MNTSIDPIKRYPGIAVVLSMVCLIGNQTSVGFALSKFQTFMGGLSRIKFDIVEFQIPPGCLVWKIVPAY